jgi:hypothetical protein
MVNLALASDEFDLLCYHADLVGILSADEEDNVSLAGVDIVILQEERLVHAIFLKSAELDNQTDSTGQRLLQY